MLNFGKKLVLIFLPLVIGLALIIYAQQKATAYQKVLSEKEALLIIDYGQRKERWFKGEALEGMTVLDILRTASRAGRFDLTAKAQIVELDGFWSGQRGEWRCYLNSQEIKRDLDKMAVNPKDKVSCRYR